MHHNPARPHSHAFTPCFGRSASPLPHLALSHASSLPYLTSPHASHFRASSHTCPTTSVSHLAPHLALQHLIPHVPHHSHISPFQRFALPRPTPSCISPSHTLRSHAPRRAASFRSPQYAPTPSTLARHLTPQPKSSPITSIEPLKNASDRSLTSAQFDPDSISVQPTPARPQSMNFL
jgi:hypothetical protein